MYGAQLPHGSYGVFTAPDAHSACMYTCVTECIVCVPGHDPLTFFVLSFLFFDWVGVLWPQLSKVLKLVRRARRVHSSGAV